MTWKYSDGTKAQRGDVIKWNPDNSTEGVYVVCLDINDTSKMQLVAFKAERPWGICRRIDEGEFKISAKKVGTLPNLYSVLKNFYDI